MYIFHIQGVQINNKHGNSVTTFIFMRHFFMNTIIAVFQLKHLISTTPGLKIFKMRCTIFVSSKLTEILRNLLQISIY